MRRWVATLLVLCLVATGSSAFAASSGEPTLDEAQALWLINTERARAGLPPVGYHSALAAAAKAHAAFVARYHRDYEKGVSAHSEPIEWRNRKGWTGVTPKDRALAQGYNLQERQVYGVGENVAWDGTDGRQVNPFRMELGPRGLFNTLWHRFALLSPELKELGAGWGSSRWIYDPARIIAVVVVMGFGEPRGRYVVRYPAPGQDNVPTTFDGETPDPLRGTGVDHAGYPISLTFSDADFGVRGAKISEASLVEKGGRSLPLLLYDMNYRYESMGPNVAIMAKQPLKPGTTYIVHIRGIVYGSRGQRPFDERWYFRTRKVPPAKAWTTGAWRFVLGDGTPAPHRLQDMAKIIDLETERGPLNIIPKNVRASVLTTVKGQTVSVKDSKPPFSDVGSAVWAAPSIYVTWAMGWLQGRSGGRFAPRGTLTEAEAAQALYRIAGEPDVSTTGALPPGTPKGMEKAVAWATKNLARGEAIVPGKPITRSKFVAWTVRTLLPEVVKLPARPPGFKDDSRIPGGHKPEVAWAKKVGLAKGRTDGRFMPTSSLTRAEAAVLWCRAFVGVGCGN